MKDLKHYFTSPVGSDNELLNESNKITSKKRRIKSVPDSLETTSNNSISSKKKRRKKYSYSELEQDELNENNSSKSDKKRKKKVTKEGTIKKPRISKLCENVNILQTIDGCNNDLECRNQVPSNSDSSKENSVSPSFCDPEEKHESSNNSLHNYFNKVDKLDIPKKINVLKVKALVHYPPSGEKLKHPKKLKTKLRRRKSIDNRPEYDIITSEEDNLCLQNSTEFAINISDSSDDVSVTKEVSISPESLNETSYSNGISSTGESRKSSSPLGESNKSVPKVKYDGTLNSFFRTPSMVASLENVCPEISEERRRAKEKFLSSGVPESMMKLIQHKKQDVVLLETSPFPKQKHITQADSLSVMWNLNDVKLKLKTVKPCLMETPSWSSITKKLEKSQKGDYVEDGHILNSLQSKNIIKKLKKEITDYPIKKWHGELLKMKKNNENDMWNVKYKPKSSLHMIGNSANVEKLKSWLQSLYNNAPKKDNPTTYCSDDEFLKSEDELEMQIKNTAILQGPSGSGKTASVYALAEEIGYKILEINASCNRMGKKILHEFSEAMQSHKVERSVINFDGSKKNKSEEIKKSLILIEDVDIIFSDYDEGFLSTITSLAATSKRPIVFTLNEFNPKLFTKIMPLINFKLNYECSSAEKLSSWIRTVGAVEGIFLDKQDVMEAVRWSNGDVRKILLKMQYSLVNGEKMNDKTNTSDHIWSRMSEHRLDSADEVINTAICSDTLAVCDVLNTSINNENSNRYIPPNSPWQSFVRDSSELVQPAENVEYLTGVMLEDISQLLSEKVVQNNSAQQITISDSHLYISKVERDIISPICVSSHKAVASDYLPTLRSIARSETNRLAAHSKRNNRYFNYLQSLGLTENTIPICNILSETFNSTI